MRIQLALQGETQNAKQGKKTFLVEKRELRSPRCLKKTCPMLRCWKSVESSKVSSPGQDLAKLQIELKKYEPSPRRKGSSPFPQTQQPSSEQPISSDFFRLLKKQQKQFSKQCFSFQEIRLTAAIKMMAELRADQTELAGDFLKNAQQRMQPAQAKRTNSKENNEKRQPTRVRLNKQLKIRQKQINEVFDESEHPRSESRRTNSHERNITLSLKKKLPTLTEIISNRMMEREISEASRTFVSNYDTPVKANDCAGESITSTKLQVTRRHRLLRFNSHDETFDSANAVFLQDLSP